VPLRAPSRSCPGRVERQRHHFVAFDLDGCPDQPPLPGQPGERSDTRPRLRQPVTACLPGLTQASNRAATPPAPGPGRG
jgi:hypothetical protein